MSDYQIERKSWESYIERSIFYGAIPQLTDRNIDPIRGPNDPTGVEVRLRNGKKMNMISLEAVLVGAVGSIYGYGRPKNATASRAVTVMISQVMMAVEQYLRLHELEGSWRVVKDGRIDSSGSGGDQIPKMAR